MGTLVCQVCQSTIDYFENEKVTVLYSTCSRCKTKKKVNQNEG